MSPRFRIAVLAGVSCVLAAWAVQGGKAIFVNGKKSSLAPIVKGSETYVPISALKAGGATVTSDAKKISIQFQPLAGRDERPYIEGIIDEYVQNEAWKIKVSNLQPLDKNPFGTGGTGFQVDIEVRNLLDRATSLHGTGLSGPRLIDMAGNSLDPTGSSFPGRYQTLEPGGSLKNTVKFGPSGPGVDVKEAEKLIFEFRPSGKPLPYKAIRIMLKAEP